MYFCNVSPLGTAKFYGLIQRQSDLRVHIYSISISTKLHNIIHMINSIDFTIARLPFMRSFNVVLYNIFKRQQRTLHRLMSACEFML